jgi:mannitol/fructose-specific phosphotransferase system IIA component (Ntr-type)
MAHPSPAPFRLSDLITPATVQLHLAGRARDEVLRELVAQIPELTGRAEARGSLLKALIDREQLHSTGIGDGIALPHARQALADLVQKPVVVFGRHVVGVSFGAIDNRPVHLFFLLVTRTVTEHLQMLARTSRLIRDARLRQSLLTTDDPEAVPTLIRSAEAIL